MYDIVVFLAIVLEKFGFEHNLARFIFKNFVFFSVSNIIFTKLYQSKISVVS